VSLGLPNYVAEASGNLHGGGKEDRVVRRGNQTTSIALKRRFLAGRKKRSYNDKGGDDFVFWVRNGRTRLNYPCSRSAVPLVLAGYGKHRREGRDGGKEGQEIVHDVHTRKRE